MALGSAACRGRSPVTVHAPGGCGRGRGRRVGGVCSQGYLVMVNVAVVYASGQLCPRPVRDTLIGIFILALRLPLVTSFFE